MSASPLAGMTAWLVRPSWVGSVVGLVLALMHVKLTHALPRDSFLLFLGMLVAVCALNGGLAVVQQLQSLRTLRALDTGQLPVEPEPLRRALREVRALPGRTSWLTLQGWAVGALLVAVAFPPLAEASWMLAARLLVVGLYLGGISTLLVYLVVVRRGRKAIERMAALGLTPMEVIAALPNGRQWLRRRLMAFIALAAVGPSLFILDASFSHALRVSQRMREAPGEEARHVVEEAREVQSRALGLFAGVAVLLALGVAWMGGTVLAEPLRALTEDAQRLARGELRTPHLIPAEDEVWTVSAALTRMQVQLAQAVVQLRRAGLQIASTTEQLVSTMAEQEEGAAEQLASLAETRFTTGDLARSAQAIAGNAEAVSTMAESTFNAAQSGQRGAVAFLSAMQRMKQDNQAIADSVVRLDKRVQQIGKVVEFINEIADKADLLALNAELEGTKAGEPGRGFSLVAAEMRRLAENVLKSTLAIERLIDEIRDSTQAAVMATEAGLKTTEGGASLAAQVDHSLGLILDLARQTTQAVRSISLATQQQKASTDLLADVMSDILRSTDQNAAATRKMLAANRDMTALASELKVAVERFRLEEGS